MNELAVSSLLSETRSIIIKLREQTETPLSPTMQIKYDSTVHVLLQPSLPTAFPSSQPYEASMIVSPHIMDERTQAFEPGAAEIRAYYLAETCWSTTTTLLGT